MNVDIAILTPIEVEYNAVRRHLNNLIEDKRNEGLYERGKFSSKVGELSVVIHEADMLNGNMAAATERIIKLFNPKIFLLVGIAGGVKDVKIGDIVVATKVYAYEAGKETADGFHARPHVGLFTPQLLDIVKSVSRKTDWKSRSKSTSGGCKVYRGAIAAGDKVIATNQGPLYNFLKKTYNDTLAVEMEAGGFSDALSRYSTIMSLCIRGISDLLEGKSESDKEGGQIKAAKNAAAFAFEILYQLDAPLIHRKDNLTSEDDIIIEDKPHKPKPPRIGLNKEIENHIKNGEIEEALTKLNEAIGGPALLLLSQYNREKKNNELGLSSSSEWKTICNNLTHSILEELNRSIVS